MKKRLLMIAAATVVLVLIVYAATTWDDRVSYPFRGSYKMYDSSGTHWVKVRVPAVLDTNYTLTLPASFSAVDFDSGVGIVRTEHGGTSQDASGFNDGEFLAHYSTSPYGEGIVPTGYDAEDFDKVHQAKHYINFNLFNPHNLYEQDPAGILLIPNVRDSMTFTRVEIMCNADPVTELNADLISGTGFYPGTSQFVIDTLVTSAGYLSNNHMKQAGVPVGNCIWLRWNAAPDSGLTQISLDFTYTR
jgi:hypothetical protein